MGKAGRTEDGNSASDAPKLVIVAGPTASGKSALALLLAARLNGVIINADAMQCYRELRILTARPSQADEAAAPHWLYGVLPATQTGNAAWWRHAALAALAQARAAGKTPILCGGTGMYMKALLHGIAEIPDPGAEARAEARNFLAAAGPAALHARLREVDPETAAKLRPSDSQRLARALEVYLGTGKGLAHWQSCPTEGLTGWTPRLILLDPPRDALRAGAAARFAGMLQAGALEELRLLLDQNLDTALPLMRAHGVPELTAYLKGETTLEDASSRAILATQQYTKRQATWFRHQKLVDSPAMHTIHSRIDNSAQLSESLNVHLENFINRVG
jgi:tRNA dimethylallyltransferase